MAVAVLGGGLFSFGRAPVDAARMVLTAAQAAAQEADMALRSVDAVFAGHGLPGSGGGTAVLAAAGLDRLPVVNVTAACASSAVALGLAATHIEHGTYRTALVVGFETMPTGMIPSSTVLNDFYRVTGLDMQPPRYALKAQVYMSKYDVSTEQLGAVAVKARRNAALNPYAHLRTPVTLDEVLSSPVIASPLTKMQCCPTSSGAAAVILGRRPPSRRSTQLVAWAMGSPAWAEDPDADIEEETTARLARQVYEMSGIGPEDVDVAQLHDAFTPGEVIRAEALGLCPAGYGAVWAAEGRTSIGGRIPINTDGGLLGRGHPLGATGLAQVIEIHRQLTGTAGDRQVDPAPRVGVCQNTGGGENAATVVSICRV